MDNQNKRLEPFIDRASLRYNHDEVTYNKIRRHLVDINDTITEEDIRNIKIFSSVTEVEINVLTNKITKTIH